jgi:type III restriction enzyme
VDLVRSESRLENSKVREVDGTEHDLPTRRHHLLAASDGEFPVDLNGWENDVLDAEMAHPNFVAWYRNPPRSAQDSLAIAYTVGDGWKAIRPDFLIFSRRADGSVAVSIVDPHGYHLGDALGKLRGLCAYAEQHAELLSRVDAVAKVGNTLRVLDLTSATVRQAVAGATDAKSLYEGTVANDY